MLAARKATSITLGNEAVRDQQLRDCNSELADSGHNKQFLLMLAFERLKTLQMTKHSSLERVYNNLLHRLLVKLELNASPKSYSSIKWLVPMFSVQQNNMTPFSCSLNGTTWYLNMKCSNLGSLERKAPIIVILLYFNDYEVSLRAWASKDFLFLRSELLNGDGQDTFLIVIRYSCSHGVEV